MNDITVITKSLVDLGFQSVFTGLIFYFGFKFFQKKFFNDENIGKMRDIHSKIDEKENLESRLKIQSLQNYLNGKSNEIFGLGIDRVSIWLNHNGLRAGKIHFLYYSLVGEIVKPGVQSIINVNIGANKLPYYIFAEFENSICEKGFIYSEDTNELSPTTLAVTKDIGTQSLLGLPICNLNGKIDGIIFFGGVVNKFTSRPDVNNIVNDIRAIFIR